MPWGVILLVGGGFSLAEGTIVSDRFYRRKFSNFIYLPGNFRTLVHVNDLLAIIHTNDED